METGKSCTKCGVFRNYSEFPKDKSHRDGFRTHCKTCQNNYKKEIRIQNKFNNLTNCTINITEQKCLNCKEIKHADEFHKNSNRKNKIHDECKSCNNARNKATRNKNREANLKETPSLKEKECPLCRKLKAVEEFSKNIGNKNGIESQCKSCRNKNIMNNRHLHIKRILYARIGDLLNGKNKSANTLSLLGCSLEFFQNWLEFQFTPEMTFENIGEYWHLDHVRPCSSFNLEQGIEQKKCFHWSNYQPLEKIENLRKWNKRNIVYETRHLFKALLYEMTTNIKKT